MGKKSVGLVILFFILAIVAYLVGLALFGLIIWAVTNLVLSQYDLEPLNYWTAVAIAFLISIIIGAFNRSRS